MRALSRAVSVLRILSAAGGAGLRLSEIARVAEMDKATTHRLLAALAAEGLVSQRSARDGYVLGPELMLLGWAAESNSFDLRAFARPTLERVAAETGDSVFLQVRSGRYCVCADRVLGSYPIKALTIGVGARRPLGIGAGSLALLSALDDDEIADVLERNARELAAASKAVAPQALRAAVFQTRERGFAMTFGHVHPLVCSIGVTVGPSWTRPIAAISISAIAERFSKTRQIEISQVLLRAAKVLSASAVSPGATPLERLRGVASR